MTPSCIQTTEIFLEAIFQLFHLVRKYAVCTVIYTPLSTIYIVSYLASLIAIYTLLTLIPLSFTLPILPCAQAGM